MHRTITLSCLLLLIGLSSAAAQERVYWTSTRILANQGDVNNQFYLGEKIQRSDLDGGQVEDLITGLTYPTPGIALDTDVGKMYWTNNIAGKIQRANLDGSDVEDLVTGIGSSVHNGRGYFALDIAGGKMYWTNTGKIQRADLDGSDVEDLVTGIGFGSIALDVTAGKMYFSRWVPREGDTPSRYQLFRTNLDGSDQENLINNRQIEIITLDVLAGKIYYSGISSNLGTINSVNLDGSEDEILIETEYTNFGAEGIALDIDGGKVYWTEDGTSKIRRANLDGSDMQELVAGLRLESWFVGSIALDVSAGKMYWTDASGSISPVIRRANLDGSNVEDLVFNRVVSPEGLAIDRTDGKMYFTDAARQRISRSSLDGSNMDGSGIEELVDTGATRPRGIALDVSAGKMYWTEEAEDRIRRADLDGGNQEDVVTGLGDPYGIALHVAAGKMYWTDHGTVKIQRANLDGSGMEDLVTTNITAPRGIALDLFGNKMYWTDSSTGKIQRADLDGSNVEDHLTEQGGGIWDVSLDIRGNRMYWTWRWQDVIMVVRRSDLDGTNAENFSVLDLSSDPTGIALELEPSALSANPTGIDLGDVAPGATRDTTFTLTNTRSDTVQIQSVTTTHPAFTTTDTTLVLAPGDTTTLSVTFAPTARGEVNARVTLTSDAPSSPHIVGLQGKGRTVQTVAITTDTSTVVYQDNDGTEATVTFTGGQANGHTLTVETFGTSPPSSVQTVPPFSSPVFYVDFTTTIPDTASFEATVTLAYTDAQLDSANITQEDSLKVAWFDSTTQVWSVVPGVLDAANNTITFTTSHFSVYALAEITPTAIAEGVRSSVPSDFVLHAARPNPFNPATMISYEVSRPAHITLVLYNMLGQEVIRLVDAYHTPGRYSAFWHGRNALGQSVASGIYVYRMTASTGFSTARRMALVK